MKDEGVGPVVSNKMVKILKRKEKSLKVKFLDKSEQKAAYKLRYDIFCKDLEWIPENKEGLDFDSYDKEALHLGVFSSGELISYCRIVQGKDNFMLATDFNDLLDLKEVRSQSIEMSRLITSKEAGRFQKFAAPLMMYRRLYQYMTSKELRYCYIVVTKDYLETINKIFPFKQVGGMIEYKPGIFTVAAYLDLRVLEDYFKNSHSFYLWFVQSRA